MLKRALQMLVISPLVALAMMARPVFARSVGAAPRASRRDTASPSRQPRKASRYYTPNGARECERRRRQIANGQLRVSA